MATFAALIFRTALDFLLVVEHAAVARIVVGWYDLPFSLSLGQWVGLWLVLCLAKYRTPDRDEGPEYVFAFVYSALAPVTILALAWAGTFWF